MIMNALDLNKVKSTHFIGIGGIGMSAVAQLFLSQGKKVSGSDTGSSKVTELLESKGAKIYFDQKAENFEKDVDLVIYTIAIDAENPELQEARKRKIPMITYPESLGLISKDKFTIAVSGTHGKTTTTAMIAKVMIDAGLNPTVIAGSLMSEYGSNFVPGKSEFFLVEACEYKRSFLNINPNILVITNIDNDHLDYYKDLADIQSAFGELARKLKPADFLICNMSHTNLEPIIEDPKVECNIIDYPSLEAKLELMVPGKHNIENAKAALAVATVLEIKDKKAIKSLKNFSGTWRRLEALGKTKNGALVYDDYGHHPTEIKASLLAILEKFPKKKIVVIFQPHLYSRTKLLLKEFAQSFEGMSEVIIVPIYAAREVDDKSISAEILAGEIKKTGISAKAMENFQDIINYIIGLGDLDADQGASEKRTEPYVQYGEGASQRSNAEMRRIRKSHKNFDSDYIIVTMGAGDVYRIAEKLVK
ncbi:MAG: UDP-N-acetylmuramate--L-alanine ligase [Patescibacteria group bacterium]